jgi:hypothetical protein
MIETSELKLKRYIGDGVYAGFDGYQVWLWCDRYGTEHSIAIDDRTGMSLNKYFNDLKRALAVDATEALKLDQI